MVDFDALKGKAEELLNEHGDKIEDGARSSVRSSRAGSATRTRSTPSSTRSRISCLTRNSPLPVSDQV